MDLVPQESAISGRGDGVIFDPVDGTPCTITPKQRIFLESLAELNSIAEVVKRLDVTEDWARSTLKNSRVRRWLSIATKYYSIQTGMTVGYWWAKVKAGIEKREDVWESKCGACGDELKLYMPPAEMTDICAVCGTQIQIKHTVIPVSYDREQAQMIVEAGNRLVPKIERVQHEFVDEEFVFKSKGESNAA